MATTVKALDLDKLVVNGLFQRLFAVVTAKRGYSITFFDVYELPTGDGSNGVNNGHAWPK